MLELLLFVEKYGKINPQKSCFNTLHSSDFGKRERVGWRIECAYGSHHRVHMDVLFLQFDMARRSIAINNSHCSFVRID